MPLNTCWVATTALPTALAAQPGRGWPNELHPEFYLANVGQRQWRISAQIHPKFELTSQSVVIKKAHSKM
jgi:hypothetical protein